VKRFFDNFLFFLGLISIFTLLLAGIGMQSALTAALSVIFSIYLIEQNLDQTFVRSYPPDAPNLFFMGIQISRRKCH